jgi:hypothetical protein
MGSIILRQHKGITVEEFLKSLEYHKIPKDSKIARVETSSLYDDNGVIIVFKLQHPSLAGDD